MRFLLITVLAVSIPIFSFGCSREKEEPAAEIARPLKVMEVKSLDDVLSNTFPGRVRAYKRADLSFKVNGRLVELPIEEGQAVTKDQVLAKLDPRDFQARLDGAKGNLGRAAAGLTLAREQYNRVLSIQKAEPGAVSQSLIDQRREGVNSSLAEIQSLRASVEAARLELSYTELPAPFDGIVSKRYVDNFQDVQAKEAILHLDDISTVEIALDLPEMLAAMGKEGAVKEVYAEFASAPGKRYPLTVYEYATRADPQTQTYEVTFRMPQPEEIRVLSGMTASVSVMIRGQAEKSGVIIVPAIAVTADDGGKAVVWVVDPDENRTKRRHVTTGGLTGTDRMEIKDGLESGETIAISGVSLLREGMLVKPVEKVEY